MIIAISLPVHENMDVIEDQIKNIRAFISHPKIFIHLGKKLNLKQAQKRFGKYKEVYLNPRQMDTGWGNIFHVHLSNIQLAQNTAYDYMLFLSSNELFIRSGVETYVQKYDVGMQRNILSQNNFTMWEVRHEAYKDPVLRNFVKKNHIQHIVGSQIEGIFIRRELLAQAMRLLGSFDDYVTGSTYPREEIFFPTCFYHVASGSKLGYPITFSEVHFDDMKVYFWQYLIDCVGKILPQDFYYWLRGGITNHLLRGHFFKLSEKHIQNLLSDNTKFFKKHMNMNRLAGSYQLYEPGCIYSVKRVPRICNDTIRVYIRNLQGGD